MPTRLIADASLPYIQGVLDEVAEVIYLPSEEITRVRIIEEKAEGLLIRSVTKCNENLLEGTAIRFIATATAGFDHIDHLYCVSRGIEWHNAPGCNARGVAHWVLCTLSSIALQKDRLLKNEQLGIVGAGNVGRNLQQMAQGIVNKVLLCDPPRAEQEGTNKFYSLSDLAAQCSLLSFHTPLTYEGKHATYHLINENFIDQCSSNAIILNAARGGIADTQALIQAVQENKLCSILLDCWEGEPHISEKLLSSADRATPHIAGFSAEGKARGSRMILEAASRFFGWTNVSLSSVQAPSLEKPFITISEKSPFWLEETFLQTAPIIDRAEISLRQNPTLFEAHRVAYPFHREPEAYIVLGGNRQQRAVLQQIGFQLG